MPIKSAVGDVPEGARVLAKRLQQYMSSDRSFVEAAIATVHHEMQMEAREHAQQLLPAFNAYRESVGLDPVEVPILREPPPLDDEPSLSADSQPQGENDASNPTRDTQAAMQAGGGGGNRRPRNPRS